MNVKSYSFSFVSTVGNVKRLTIIETRMFLKWMYPLYTPLNKPFDSTYQQIKRKSPKDTVSPFLYDVQIDNKLMLSLSVKVKHVRHRHQQRVNSFDPATMASDEPFQEGRRMS